MLDYTLKEFWVVGQVASKQGLVRPRLTRPRPVYGPYLETRTPVPGYGDEIRTEYPQYFETEK